MRKRHVLISLGCWALMGAMVSSAQQSRKAGLWQIATSTRIQQPGEAPGNFVAHGNSNESVAGGLPVCLTQELVDTYGVILPPSLKDCELSNVLQTADSFKADMTCKGGYNGFGSVESIWTDEEHATGKVRFVSKSGANTNARALIWTEEATAVFKSSDCGTVKPRRMPAK